MKRDVIEDCEKKFLAGVLIILAFIVVIVLINVQSVISEEINPNPINWKEFPPTNDKTLEESLKYYNELFRDKGDLKKVDVRIAQLTDQIKTNLESGGKLNDKTIGLLIDKLRREAVVLVYDKLSPAEKTKFLQLLKDSGTRKDAKVSRDLELLQVAATGKTIKPDGDVLRGLDEKVRISVMKDILKKTLDGDLKQTDFSKRAIAKMWNALSAEEKKEFLILVNKNVQLSTGASKKEAQDLKNNLRFVILQDKLSKPPYGDKFAKRLTKDSVKLDRLSEGYVLDKDGKEHLYIYNQQGKAVFDLFNPSLQFRSVEETAGGLKFTLGTGGEGNTYSMDFDFKALEKLDGLLSFNTPAISSDSDYKPGFGDLYINGKVFGNFGFGEGSRSFTFTLNEKQQLVVEGSENAWFRTKDGVFVSKNMDNGGKFSVALSMEGKVMSVKNADVTFPLNDAYNANVYKYDSSDKRAGLSSATFRVGNTAVPLESFNAEKANLDIPIPSVPSSCPPGSSCALRSGASSASTPAAATTSSGQGYSLKVTGASDIAVLFNPKQGEVAHLDVSKESQRVYLVAAKSNMIVNVAGSTKTGTFPAPDGRTYVLYNWVASPETKPQVVTGSSGSATSTSSGTVLPTAPPGPVGSSGPTASGRVTPATGGSLGGSTPSGATGASSSSSSSSQNFPSPDELPKLIKANEATPAEVRAVLNGNPISQNFINGFIMPFMQSNPAADVEESFSKQSTYSVDKGSDGKTKVTVGQIVGSGRSVPIAIVTGTKIGFLVDNNGKIMNGRGSDPPPIVVNVGNGWKFLGGPPKK